ncbi:hypothetical protein DLH85_26000, partial [Vibrio parahaemolyticus]|nr:hypothetical protein [Vibrio parahaemolyticus]
FTASNFLAISLARFLLCCWLFSLQFGTLVLLSKFGDRILFSFEIAQNWLVWRVFVLANLHFEVEF